MRKCIMAGGLVPVLIFGSMAVSAAASLLTNGDFASPIALQGWSNPLGTVSEPTGAFALIGGTDGSGTNSLVQTVTSALPLQTFAFDFVFATQGSAGAPGFPDSFTVSITAAGTPGAFLDILQIDVVGGVDTSGPFSTIATAPFVTLTSPVVIPGFTPGFTPGVSLSGRLTLDLSDASFLPLVSTDLTIAFDVIDVSNMVQTVAAIDHVSLTTVPEPTALLLFSSSLAGLALWRHRTRPRLVARRNQNRSL